MLTIDQARSALDKILDDIADMPKASQVEVLEHMVSHVDGYLDAAREEVEEEGGANAD